MASVQRRAIQRDFLPFVQHAVRAAFRPPEPKEVNKVEATPSEGREASSEKEPPIDIGYVRRVWNAARDFLEPWLAGRGDDVTQAWNIVYLAADTTGIVGEKELLGYARRAVSIEARGGLPAPSAARAVLMRLAANPRLRDYIKDQLLRRISATTNRQRRRQLGRLLAEIEPRTSLSDAKK